MESMGFIRAFVYFSFLVVFGQMRSKGGADGRIFRYSGIQAYIREYTTI